MRSLFLSVLATTAVLCADAIPAVAAERDITITAHNFAFAPAIVKLERGATYALHLRSTDGPHGLDVPEIGLHHLVLTSRAQTVTIAPTTIGTFVAHCTQYCGAGHATMAMTFVVAGRAATGTATAKPAKAGNPCSAPPS